MMAYCRHDVKSLGDMLSPSLSLLLSLNVHYYYGVAELIVPRLIEFSQDVQVRLINALVL